MNTVLTCLVVETGPTVKTILPTFPCTEDGHMAGLANKMYVAIVARQLDENYLKEQQIHLPFILCLFLSS